MPIGSGLDVGGVPIATDGESRHNLESLSFSSQLGWCLGWGRGGWGGSQLPKSCLSQTKFLAFFLYPFFKN